VKPVKVGFEASFVVYIQGPHIQRSKESGIGHRTAYRKCSCGKWRLIMLLRKPAIAIFLVVAVKQAN